MKTEDQIKQATRVLGVLSASLAELTDRKIPTIGEFSKTWLEQQLASSEHRDSTKRAKEYQIRRNIGPAFGHIPLDKFGNADWNRWVREMRASTERHKQVTRFFNARKTMTEILNAALDQGVIDRKPKLEQPDERRNVGRVITEREVWWILRNTTYRVFRLFFYTMYKMGCRPREILRWEVSMLRRSENGKVWIDIPARITKTARARQIPINPSVAKHIIRVLKENPNSRFVFQNRIHPDAPQLSYHGAWRTAVMKAMQQHPEMKPCVPYDLRRSKITREMVNGKPPAYLAKLLDTSVPMIERVYLKEDAPTMEALVE